MKEIFYCLSLLLFMLFKSYAQVNSDSIISLANKASHDSVKCRIYNNFINENPDDPISYALNKKIMQLASKNLSLLKSNEKGYNLFLEFYATSYNFLGYYNDMQGLDTEAEIFYKKSLKIFEKINKHSSLAGLKSNIAAIYINRGNITAGLNLYNEALDHLKKENDDLTYANILANLGSVYKQQGDLENALKYYDESILFYKKSDFIEGIIENYNAIGTIYHSMNKPKLELEFYLKGTNLAKQMNRIRELSYGFYNLSGYYQETDRSVSKRYIDSAIYLFKKLNDPDGYSSALYQAAINSINDKNYEEAEKKLIESIEISKKIGYPARITTSAQLLYRLQKKLSKHKNALETYELFIQMRDSMNNIENKKAALKLQFKKDLEEKENEIKMRSQVEKEKIMLAAEGEKQKRNYIIGAAFMILISLTIFLFFIYRSLQENKKARQIIAQQKMLVEEKQTEIIDSIHYAQKIQKALLAGQSILNRNLSNYFILFKPKDIVSGDFYWAAETKDHFYFIVADSTGHGVPGAFMSLLNINFLNEAITEKKLLKPAEILNHVRKRLIENLTEEGSVEGGKDGMDCSLMCFHKNTNQLDYACANHQLIIIRDNHILETITNKMPVGKSPKDNIPFEQGSFSLQKNDFIFATTDGFSDQFGGPKNKKFMSKNLKDLIMKTKNEETQKIKQILENEFMAWKGVNEQVDDVLIAGIKI